MCRVRADRVEASEVGPPRRPNRVRRIRIRHHLHVVMLDPLKQSRDEVGAARVVLNPDRQADGQLGGAEVLVAAFAPAFTPA